LQNIILVSNFTSVFDELYDRFVECKTTRCMLLLTEYEGGDAQLYCIGLCGNWTGH